MNACNSLSVGTVAVTIFQSAAASGADMDGALALSIYNSGGTDAMVKSTGHHDDVTNLFGSPAPTQWMPLPAGKSVTIEVENNAGSYGQLQLVKVKTASSSTTIGWGVTKRR